MDGNRIDTAFITHDPDWGWVSVRSGKRNLLHTDLEACVPVTDLSVIYDAALIGELWKESQFVPADCDHRDGRNLEMISYRGVFYGLTNSGEWWEFEAQLPIIQ